MIYSNDTYDITNDISTYLRRDFNSVFDTSRNKWFMLNNLGNYEEYGIYGTDFSSHYVGKLVEVDGHEYEWDGTEWDDLGESGEVVTSVYRDENHNGYITFPQNSTQVASVEVDFKLTSDDGNYIIGSGTSDSNDWRLIFVRTYMTGVFYDCGSGRAISQLGNFSEYYNIRRRLRLDGNPMRVYDCDTETYLYTGSTTRPTGCGIYWGGYSEMDGWDDSNGLGYVYNIIFYSDNGETAIANYIPYVQNNVAGLYDTMSNTFVAPTQGTINAETSESRPKEYPTKAAPTITNYWNSRVFRNGSLIVKALQSDELLNLKYKDKNVLIKSEHEEDPYNTKAYIQFPNTSNETPSFITNTYLKNTYTLEFKIQTPSSNGSQWRITIGSKQDEQHRFELYTNANNQYMCINWWNYGQNRLYNDYAFTLAPNTTYVYEIQIGTGVTKINGVTQSASGGNNVSGTLTAPLAIGGALEAGTAVFNGKIYYAKITEGDTLVAYYQADNTNNTPGFVDLVSGTKILKQGTGTVTYGEDA